MTAAEYAALAALAQAWIAQLHRQGTQTEILAHEAYILDQCARDVQAYLKTVRVTEPQSG